MFYVFLVFHLLLFLESYFLFKKRQRRKAILLFVMNFVMLIINMLVFAKTLSLTYSSVIYLISLLKNQVFLAILWFILNIIFIGTTYYFIYLASLKKKQNKILKLFIIILMGVIIFFIMITLLNHIASLLLLIIIIGSLVKLVTLYIKGKQNYILASIFIISVFAIYSFGFYTGAARFQIALQGYPVLAYNTGLEELRFAKEPNMKKYVPIEEVPTDEEDIGVIQIKNYFGIKLGTSYKY